MEAAANLGGAHCAAHEGAQATGTCARCGDFVCPLCLDPDADQAAWCTYCRERDGGNRVPWERDEGSLIGRWWRTARGVLFSPSATFERVQPGSLKRALAFNALTGLLIGGAGSALGACGLGLVLALGGSDALLPGGPLSREGGDVQLFVVLALTLLSAPLTAAYAVCVAGLRGLVYFLAVRIVGGGSDPKTALWMTSYLGAAQLSWPPILILQRLPMVGPVLALLAHLAVEIYYAIELTSAAERYAGLSSGRAAMAGWAFFVLLSALVGSCCLGAFVIGASGL